MSEDACHAWTVLCRRSAVDPESDSLTLVDMIEEVALESVSVPEGADGVFLRLDAELVSLWSRTALDLPSRIEGRVRLFTPRGRPAGKIRFDVDLSEKHRVHQRMRFHLLPFEGPGLCWFHVEAKAGEEWRSVARLPLEITTGIGIEGAAVAAK
jgi:hypothetical protein